MIPVSSPKESYLKVSTQIDTAVMGVLKSGWYIHGESCKRFEREFAAFCNVPHCIGVANGTDAVELALRSVGVQAGDFVATVANTAVATVAAIERIGAIPCFIDVEKDTQTLSPASLKFLLERGDSIKAVVAVHLFGHPVELKEIIDLSKVYQFRIVEDCAQAHGAEYDGKRVGSIGDVGAFSFYPTKNLGAMGDGGGIITNSAKIADTLMLLRQYGWRERYISEIIGFNSRLDEMQAAILSVKLQNLDLDNQKRQMIADRYQGELGDLTDIILPIERSNCRHVYHQYTICCLRDRDALAKYLANEGIGTAVLYPIPIHKQPAYASRYEGVELPITEQLANQILCLPMYPELSIEDQRLVCQKIRAYFDKK
jgi:dTDP-4-amino-4,6-dideoxygalactose transaminase